MVYYKINSPVKHGNVWAVDIIEYVGNSITRRTTVRLDQVQHFIKAFFHELPESIKKLL